MYDGFAQWLKPGVRVVHYQISSCLLLHLLAAASPARATRLTIKCEELHARIASALTFAHRHCKLIAVALALSTGNQGCLKVRLLFIKVKVTTFMTFMYDILTFMTFMLESS